MFASGSLVRHRGYRSAPMIESVLQATPWFWPTLAVAVVASVILYRPVARLFGAPNVVALLLLVSLGGIVALTLTPGGFAFEPSESTTCDLRLVPPLALDRLLSLGQRSLNVLLFVPFGRERRAAAVERVASCW